MYDVGRTSDGQPYIKMEYIDGCNLSKYYEEHGKLNWEECILIIREVINGISCAHHNDIIHRDLRPENVLCAFDKKTVKVIDFGISAFIDIENHTRLTRTGEYPAGGSFADPALAENPKLRDCRSDIYSIGGLMFYLLSGRNPSGSDMKRVLQTSNTGLSNEHVDIVMKGAYGTMSEARAFDPAAGRTRTVTVIPARVSALPGMPTFAVRPKRVAAYARVSTKSEEQLTSYEAQVKHYTEHIKSKEHTDNWQFVDVYTDMFVCQRRSKMKQGRLSSCRRWRMFTEDRCRKLFFKPEKSETLTLTL